jgi:hypothetical protein
MKHDTVLKMFTVIGNISLLTCDEVLAEWMNTCSDHGTSTLDRTEILYKHEEHKGKITSYKESLNRLKIYTRKMEFLFFIPGALG